MSGRVAAILRRVVAIKEGEAAALVGSCVYSFCLLAGYYILRPLREEMGVAAGGVRNLPWLFLGTLLTMLVLSPPFSALVSRFSRRRFIPYAYRFFTLNLLIFFILFETLKGDARVGVAWAFFIWTSVFNLFVVSVFWGYMADVFTSEQGKRLFGVIAAGGTLGGIAGSGLTASMVHLIGTMPLLLVAAALVEGSVLAFRSVDRLPLARGAVAAAPAPARAAVSAGAPAATGMAARAGDGGGLNRTGIWGGLTLVLRSPYLLGIVLYILLFTTTSTFAYYEQARIVGAHSTSPEARTAIFARIDLLVSIVTLVVQLFLTGRMIRRIGVGLTQSILPVLSLAGFAAMAFQPVLGVLMAFQVVRRSADYAAAKPAREVLFTVLDREEKYKAKSFIDTFVYRGGDWLAGQFLYPLVTAGGDPATRVMMAALPLTALWVVVCLRLGRRQQELAVAGMTPAPVATAI